MPRFSLSNVLLLCLSAISSARGCFQIPGEEVCCCEGRVGVEGLEELDGLSAEPTTLRAVSGNLEAL
jgi:hypothetical protein